MFGVIVKMFDDMLHRLVANRYIHEEVVRKTVRMRPGMKRTLLRTWMCAVVIAKHRFRLRDYRHEMDSMKKNGCICCFKKHGKDIMMYLPRYEEDYIQYFIAECSDFYETDVLLKHSPVIFIEIFDDRFSKVDGLLRSYGYIRSRSIESNHIYVSDSHGAELPDFYDGKKQD